MLPLYMKCMNLKDRFLKTGKDEGQGLVEYALIIVLISLIVLLTYNEVTDGLNNAFSRIGSALSL